MIARRLKTVGFSLAFGAILAVGAAGAAPLGHSVAHAATPPAGTRSIVHVAHRGKFGNVLVNAKGFALYYWAKETNGTVKCTGQCATVWPPALLTATASAPRHIAGVMGTFGVAMRPDGTHQLTFNHHPLYTFQGDKTPSQILCDGVAGWHVIRLGSH